jgi:hypothetical protein
VSPDPTVHADLEQLKMLLEYATFYIGIYLSMTAGFFTLVKSDKSSVWGVGFDKMYLGIAGGLIGAAGVCGGIVGSSTVQFRGLQEFMNAPIGPWNCHWLTGAQFAHLEHTLFWAGLAFAVIALWRGEPDKAATPGPASS